MPRSMASPPPRQLVDSLASALHEFEQNPSVDLSSAVAELKRILLLHIDGLEAVETSEHAAFASSSIRGNSIVPVASDGSRP